MAACRTLVKSLGAGCQVHLKWHMVNNTEGVQCLILPLTEMTLDLIKLYVIFALSTCTCHSSVYVK